MLFIGNTIEYGTVKEWSQYAPLSLPFINLPVFRIAYLCICDGFWWNST